MSPYKTVHNFILSPAYTCTYCQLYMFIPTCNVTYCQLYILTFLYTYLMTPVHTFCHLYILSVTCTYLLLSKLFILIATKHTYCYLYVPTASTQQVFRIIYCIRYLCTPIITCSYLLPLYIPITTFTYLLTASKQQVFDITCTYLLLLDMPYLSSPVHIFCIYCTGYLYIPIITWLYLLSTIQTYYNIYLPTASKQQVFDIIYCIRYLYIPLVIRHSYYHLYIFFVYIALDTCTYLLSGSRWLDTSIAVTESGRVTESTGWRAEARSSQRPGFCQTIIYRATKQRRLFCKN